MLECSTYALKLNSKKQNVNSLQNYEFENMNAYNFSPGQNIDFKQEVTKTIIILLFNENHQFLN